MLQCIHQKFECWSASELIISCNWSQSLIFHFIFFCHTKKYVSKWWFNLILSFNKNTCIFFVAASASLIWHMFPKTYIYTIWSILFDIKRDPIGDVEFYCCFVRMHQQCHAKIRRWKKYIEHRFKCGWCCSSMQEKTWSRIYLCQQTRFLALSIPLPAHRTCLRSYNTIKQFFFSVSVLTRGAQSVSASLCRYCSFPYWCTQFDSPYRFCCCHLCVCPNTQISLK